MKRRVATFALILAGGRGTRLLPLTRRRIKPLMPFAGGYRLIDFTLANILHSQIKDAVLLAQYDVDRLMAHVESVWSEQKSVSRSIECLAPNALLGESELGSADAVRRGCAWLLARKNGRLPRCLVVCGADHVYRTNFDLVVDCHLKTGASVTIIGGHISKGDAKEFGVVVVGGDSRVTEFTEKPSNPVGLPENPEVCLVSMGDYVFNTEILLDTLGRSYQEPTLSHDLSRDVVRHLVRAGSAYFYDYSKNVIPGELTGGSSYWRDVGTLDSYWSANMDVLGVNPRFCLDNGTWQVRSRWKHLGRQEINDSYVGEQTAILGTVTRSILGQRVGIEQDAHIDSSVLMDNVQVGKNAKIRNAIIDEGAKVSDGALIGYDKLADRRRYLVTDRGITVVFD